MGLFAFTDGACRETNPGKCAAAYAVFTSSDGSGNEVYGGARYIGIATNNQAEYVALIDLLVTAEAKQIKGLTIYSDSQLIVNQSTGKWKVGEKSLEDFQASAYALLIRGGHTLKWVKGHSGNPGNERVDYLCNQVLDREQEREKKCQRTQ